MSTLTMTRPRVRTVATVRVATLGDIHKVTDRGITARVNVSSIAGCREVTTKVMGVPTTYLIDSTNVVRGRVEMRGDAITLYAGRVIRGGRYLGSSFISSEQAFARLGV